jgi:ketosteroid isomerase-like protein
MIPTHRLWPSLTLVALLVACAPQEAADVTEQDAETVAAVQVLDAEAAAAVLYEMEQGYVDAYGAEDPEGVAALFAADATQGQPLKPSLDVAGIQAAYEATFASGADYSLEVEREGMVVAPGWIASWGGFVATVVAEGEEPFTVKGRYGAVQRQEPDGTWKLYRHMFNYETPPPDFGT